jgi:3-oxoacyl-[acyl-carrier protein] reductase
VTSLSGRTALITGGSRGIGAAIARKLAALGADIIVTYQSNAVAANEVAVECGGRAVQFSVTEPVDGLASRADIVVANAAAPYPKLPLAELPVSALTAKITADVGCLHRLVTHFVPGMRGYGRVIVIGSMHARGPFAPGMTANGVTKAALEAYVSYAVEEFASPGVTFNTVHPGYIATDLSSGLPPAIPEWLGRLTPSGREGLPSDVAGVVAMLADPGMDFVNGATIPVSGGLNHPVSFRRVLHDH